MSDIKHKDIKVIVLDSGVNIEEYEGIKIIRIKSDIYNLLIYRDYWPIIGEITGTVSIEGETNKKFENIRGFYALRKNIFHLIIKDKEETVE